MKITIAPSKDQSTEKFKFYSVTVENSDDEAEISQAIEMTFQALHGWGFDADQIHKAFNEFTR